MAAEPRDRPPSRRTRRRRTIEVLLVLLVVLVVLGLVLFAYDLGRRHGAEQARAAPTEPEVVDTPTEEPAAPADPAPPVEANEEAQAERDSSSDRSDEGRAEAEPAPGTALFALSELEVGPSDPRDGYDRDMFGWRTFDHDGNGCDIRNDVLRRDLIEFETDAVASDCKVETGTLHDPYTATEIDFVIGGGRTSDGGVQIDHVVALFDAWISGAQEWDEEEMVVFANDPLNLLAVDGEANQQKGASDASNWLPPNSEFHCPYVARQVAVKLEYELLVTQAEHAAMADVLAECPEEALPTEQDSNTP